MVEESMVIGIFGGGSSRRPRSVNDCRARRSFALWRLDTVTGY
jgi:hypothetical protein